ncbi:MAG: hypothetical protein JO034_11700 [Singulisphaera sp.]|nr:hypothetical protein [Singulisphaera sp.]
MKKGVLPSSDEEYFIYGEGQATTTMRSEYLHSVLCIPDGTDEADYLLNPKVIFPDGEWEAWKFAHWYPGAVRTRSFREMMEGTRSRAEGDSRSDESQVRRHQT